MGNRKKWREGEPTRAYLRSIVDSVVRSDARPTLESQVVQLVLEKHPNLAPWRSDLFDLARNLLRFPDQVLAGPYRKKSHGRASTPQAAGDDIELGVLIAV